MADARTPLLAVLIDADNTSPAWAEAIFREIASLGEASVRRAYGDFSSTNMRGWSAVLAKLGIVPHHQPSNTTGKNSSDIALVIDAMDLLLSGRFDGFVLVSSDSDFTALANRVREQGMDVIGIGEAKAPESLRNVCNRFILIENIVDEPEPAAKGARPAQAGKQDPIAAVPLILKAMDKIQQDDEWYALGQIGQYITAEHPDFDARTYGKRKLSDLVQGLKRFETRRAGNQLQIRRVD